MVSNSKIKTNKPTAALAVVRLPPCLDTSSFSVLQSYFLSSELGMYCATKISGSSIAVFRCLRLGRAQCLLQNSSPLKIVICRSVVIRPEHAPTDFERKVLTWTKAYPKQQVPATVPVEKMRRAKNKFRIKIANYMMLTTLLMAFGMAWLGKREAALGNTVSKRNLEWHAKINEKHE